MCGADTSNMFSFLSALGYSLFVLDDESGRMSPLNAGDAAAFNNESRCAFIGLLSCS